MKISSIISSIVSLILKIAVVCVVAVFVYRYALQAYDFGYRIFAETPVSSEPGVDISVAIVEGKSAKEVGQILEEKGLIRDAKIFWIQEILSEYHGYLAPGIYELNTSMTIEQMIDTMVDMEAYEADKLAKQKQTN